MTNITGLNGTVNQFAFVGNEVFGEPLIIGIFMLAILGIWSWKGGGTPLLLAILIPAILVLGGLLPEAFYITILMLMGGVIAFGFIKLFT